MIWEGDRQAFKESNLTFLVVNKIFLLSEDEISCSKLISFLCNKKSSLNQNVMCDHATMQQDVLLHFWMIFYTEIRPKCEEIILLSSSRPFNCLPPCFSCICLTLWKTVRLPGKKLQNVTNSLITIETWNGDIPKFLFVRCLQYFCGIHSITSM